MGEDEHGPVDVDVDVDVDGDGDAGVDEGVSAGVVDAAKMTEELALPCRDGKGQVQS